MQNLLLFLQKYENHAFCVCFFKLHLYLYYIITFLEIQRETSTNITNYDTQKTKLINTDFR